MRGATNASQTCATSEQFLFRLTRDALLRNVDASLRRSHLLVSLWVCGTVCVSQSKHVAY